MIKKIKFICCGYQENIDNAPGFFLFNIAQDILGHMAGSTVSATTLRRHGVTDKAITTEIVRYLKSPITL